MPLEEYRARRNFERTGEPTGGKKPGRSKRPIFVVQEHHASHLHYDFRLEADGVLKSWAVPKGPSLDPSVKRLAVQVEDHPIGYASFEGTIPEGQYGGGTVKIWDRGTYESLATGDGNAPTVSEAIEGGRIEFILHGGRLKGRFALIRMKARRGDKPQWLLMKLKDEFARAEEAPPRPIPSPSPRARKPPRARRPTETPEAIELTNPGRIIFPEAGLTKQDVFEYYGKIADRLIPFLEGRPITLERLPKGLAAGGPHFWQKDTPGHYPDWIPRIELPTERGEAVDYALVNDEATLLYLVNQGTLTFHAWASRLPDLDHPDFVLFDLDPGQAPFSEVIAVAKAVKEALDGEGVEAFVKTSGKSGLHVLSPWKGAGGFDEARAWSLDVARRTAETMPDRATTEVRKAKRGGRVYIDVMQNARGHHAVPPYVLRAVAGATISTPLHWWELVEGLTPASFTPATIFRRLADQGEDPFARLLAAASPARSAARKAPRRRAAAAD